MRTDEEGDFVAEVQELAGCVSHGKDPAEAWNNVREVQRAWIEERLESGDPIPEPQPEEDLPSGKWVQRVPRTLHKRLSEAAKQECVSLNQLVTSLLSSALMTKSIAELVGAHIVASHATYSAPWQRNAQHDWIISDAYHGDLLTNLEIVQRLLPAPAKKKDAYDPKDITIYTHKEAAGSGRR
jgi:predicted RNase H-like HicB family nuclease